MAFLPKALCVAALLAPALGVAATPEDGYYTIASVQTEKVSSETWPGSFQIEATPNDGGVIPSLDCSGQKSGVHGLDLPNMVSPVTLINMGLQMWKLIEANKPVVDAQWASANALPSSANCRALVTGWQVPVAETYRTTYKNLFGVTVVDFTYRIVYTYGGSIGGVGKFLSNVQVMPANLTVLWGFNFTANVTVPNVVNTTTIENPVAGMQVVVDWTVKTALKYDQQSTTYFVRGDGELTKL